MKKQLIALVTAMVVVCCYTFEINAQGPTPQYPGPGASLGFDTGCGAPGITSVGVPSQVMAPTAGGLGANPCITGTNVTQGVIYDTGIGFEVPITLTNMDIDVAGSYSLNVSWGPSNNNCCDICTNLAVDFTQNAACGTFSPSDPTIFGLPNPLDWGTDIFGGPVFDYTDLCPNTQYDVFINSMTNTVSGAPAATPANPPPPGDDICLLQVSTEVFEHANLEGPVTVIAPGTRDAIAIANESITVAAASNCGDANIIFDWSADITAGCTVSFGTCSMGLETEIVINEACSGLAFTTNELVADPTGCYVSQTLSGQIIISGADICAALACNPNATIDIYSYYTFCEAADINGDGTGNDEAIASISLATAIGGNVAACCAAPPACATLTAAPAVNGCDLGDGAGFLADINLSACTGADGPVPTGVVYDVYLYAPGGVPQAAPAGYEATAIPVPSEFPDPFGDGNLTNIDFDLTCADAIANLILQNPTCEPATFSFFYFSFDYGLDSDGNSVAEYDPTCTVARHDVTVYPTLVAEVDSDDSANCGDVVVTLYTNGGTANGGAACNTETVSCVADGDPTSVTFTMIDTDGTVDGMGTLAPIVENPDGSCNSLTAAGVDCAGCGAAACDIVTAVSNIVCDDNGTPADPADDTFTFDVTVTQLDATFTTFSSDGGDAGVAYGGPAITYGPYPISGGTVTINYTDDTDATCTETADGVPPAPCSGCAADAGAFCPPAP